MTREGLVKCREQFKPLFAEPLKPISLLDVLTQTEQWLNWSRLFLLVSAAQSMGTLDPTAMEVVFS